MLKQEGGVNKENLMGSEPRLYSAGRFRASRRVYSSISTSKSRPDSGLFFLASDHQVNSRAGNGVST